MENKAFTTSIDQEAADLLATMEINYKGQFETSIDREVRALAVDLEFDHKGHIETSVDKEAKQLTARYRDPHSYLARIFRIIAAKREWSQR